MLKSKKMKFKTPTILLFIILMTGLQLQAQTTLTGKVLDSNDNEPLVGASVSVAGTTLGSATSIDGTFSLNVENLPVKLSISFIGYQTNLIFQT